MRLPFASLLLFLPALPAFVACSPAPYPEWNDDDHQSYSTSYPPSVPATPAPATPAKQPAKPDVPAEAAAHPEVVSVLMTDRLNRGWFCTGTLVSPTRVVTAAHCLDTTMMKAWAIEAPLAPGAPFVTGKTPASFSTGFEDVANPDLGVLELTRAVSLDHYAELTDVGPRVDAGEALEVGAIVRSDEEPDAPFTSVPPMPLSSTVEYGYEHGFGVPLYSKGGDSGSGLFLIENGELTHKLVAVARQPEPARSIDHSSRIDASFLAWYATLPASD